jgi:pimeloyl-ACP methyl ester carboxylesterase
VVRYLEAGGARLEYAWHGPAPDEAPTLVFLHEGLGSLTRWRDVPADLAGRTGCGALVYSRAGYGRSGQVALPRPTTFMHREAETLAEVLGATGVREAILVGHSDGASIAIIYAGSVHHRQATPPRLRGLALLAPHVFVEPCGLESIARSAERFRTTDMRDRLAKHHGDNVDVAFWGWTDVWLHPDFLAWNIEEFLGAIRAPILVVQGEQDEYGTWAQVEAIRRQAAGPVETISLSDCGHVPQKDRRDVVVPAIAEFVRSALR